MTATDRLEATRQAFLDDIIAHPDRDDVRLIYADWLDDHGEEERAKFIRVQCEDTRREWLVDPHEGHTCVLNPCPLCADAADRKRLWKNERYWVECNRQHLRQKWTEFDVGLARQAVSVHEASTGILLFRRGFVAEVQCPFSAWMKHGPAIVRSQPVEVVRLTDRGPSYSSVAKGWIWQRLSGYAIDTEDVIGDLYSHLSYGPTFYYESEQEAVDDLSRACLAWARSQPRGG